MCDVSICPQFTLKLQTMSAAISRQLCCCAIMLVTSQRSAVTLIQRLLLLLLLMMMITITAKRDVSGLAQPSTTESHCLNWTTAWTENYRRKTCDENRIRDCEKSDSTFAAVVPMQTDVSFLIVYTTSAGFKRLAMTPVRRTTASESVQRNVALRTDRRNAARS